MKPLNILVMEDDAVIAMLLGEVLAAMGHRVCATAATEDDGIMAAARCHPDLLIVLRHEPVPHLFVTANTNSVRALRPDAVVIEKPFSQEQLARALSQVYSPAG